MRTLFLTPPSYAGFDGGAGARYQARREIRSYWYATWLAQPAAPGPGSPLVERPRGGPAAPPPPRESPRARGPPPPPERERPFLYTSSPTFGGDVKAAEALKAA